MQNSSKTPFLSLNEVLVYTGKAVLYDEQRYCT